MKGTVSHNFDVSVPQVTSKAVPEEGIIESTQERGCRSVSAHCT